MIARGALKEGKGERVQGKLRGKRSEEKAAMMQALVGLYGGWDGNSQLACALSDNVLKNINIIIFISSCPF